MKSLWKDTEAKPFLRNPLDLRVYTSRLLGREADLVLHGGGNTSVKIEVKNLFGERDEILYVKGSGWDLATIEADGFAPVKMRTLKKMEMLERLSDPEMVKLQRASMIDPSAPNPSVEAILHAIIPFCFVDHTHADAVVTLTDTPHAQKYIQEIYGDRVLLIPYVMPGFLLAKKIYQMTKNLDWNSIDGMVLMNHGVFTFHDDAKKSYEMMIRLVSQAEAFIKKKNAEPNVKKAKCSEDLLELARIRQAVSKAKKSPMIARLDQSPEAVSFSNSQDVSEIAARGTITPDHVIRTKRAAVVIGGNCEKNVADYVKAYERYFKKYAKGKLTALDPAPRWAVWPGYGTISFGPSLKDAEIAFDIVQHTIRAIRQAEALGGWKPLGEKEIFEIEYWDLEQAKLKKDKKSSGLQGKIALVTGAASGIGKACVEALHAQGAVVAGLDLNPLSSPTKSFGDNKKGEILGRVCDITDSAQLKKSVKEVVRTFGGLDILISNAGVFPPSANISEMKTEIWDQSLAVNLSSHQALLQACIPYLTLGIDPAVVIIASKNVPAPGPGASAYSVAKAGLTQLARVAALELGPLGIRVNVIHPNQVFDTAIWTPEVLKSRAQKYGVSVEEYKSQNLLKTQITSKDVAGLACALAGPLFSKTTGAQIPIDGGNERVI